MENNRTIRPTESPSEDGLIKEDPWIHRSRGMLCRTCIYFVRKEASVAVPLDPRGSTGRCRRHAPTMNGYPVVFQTDWCGDHKLNENIPK